MKKTLTVNLGGTVFNIDDDAYRLLDNYLCDLKAHFSTEEGAEEIVDDIERRVSELLAEKLAAGQQVITIADVEEVISRIGNPDEMDGNNGNQSQNGAGGSAAGTTGAANGSTGSAYTAQGGSSRQRRLFRNPDDKILGGVISGIAAYLNWDVTLLRLLLLVILICGWGTLVPVYIICWILIPEARTAAEKLSMRGEEVTVENIGKTVTDGFTKMADGVNKYMNSDKSRTAVQKFFDTLVAICGWVLKVLLVIFVVVFSPVLLVMAIVLVALLIAMVAAAIGGGAALVSLFPAFTWAATMSPLPILVMYISATLLITIPLFSLIWILWNQLNKNSKSMNKGLKWTLLILWIVSAACFGITFTKNDYQMPPFHCDKSLFIEAEEEGLDEPAHFLHGLLQDKKSLTEEDMHTIDEARKELEEVQSDMAKELQELKEQGEPEGEPEKFARKMQESAIKVVQATIGKTLEELHPDSIAKLKAKSDSLKN